MSKSFSTTITQDPGGNATGIQVPDAVIMELNAGKKPPVKVTLKGYSYRSTVAVMDGRFMIPLSAEHRTAAGVKGGDSVEVTLELDTEPRTVEIPTDLAEALENRPGAMDAFNKTPFSMRKEYVRQVETARAAETRARRITGIVEKVVG